ncbi:MAG: RNA methyltransferase [Bacteroidetes bacterium]|nr:RNA methyltransferase [Bacteroidota bacterium]
MNFDTIFIPYMISKAQVKHIRSLDDKKKRYEYKQFVVEGIKMVDELLKSQYEIVEIFATQYWISNHAPTDISKLKISLITEQSLSRISGLKTPNEVLALVVMPDATSIPNFDKALALDNIQDPGNLGSIIRIADWFGISTIICNAQTVDVYNPKVLQATMGSVFRVTCYYTDLLNYIRQQTSIKTYAAVLNGSNVNEMEKITNGLILIGNESVGIDEKLIQHCDFEISIPQKGNAESLNAAVATGIICNTLFK